MYTFFLSLISIILGFNASIQDHEFHLSKAMIKHNTEEKAVQISLHLYIDDFEDALKARGADSLFICTKMENKEADKYIYLYLQDRLKLKVDDQEVYYHYLGKEISEDLQGVWMYLEVYDVESIQDFTVSNQLLTEIFEDQQNVMNIRANNKEHYFMLNKDDSTKTLTWK